MMFDEKKNAERLLREARIWLIGACVAAAAVVSIAVGLNGQSPYWGDALRWVLAGYSFAGAVSALASYRAALRAREQLAEMQAEMEETARQFADTVCAELARRGIDSNADVFGADILRVRPMPRGRTH